VHRTGRYAENDKLYKYKNSRQSRYGGYRTDQGRGTYIYFTGQERKRSKTSTDSGSKGGTWISR